MCSLCFSDLHILLLSNDGAESPRRWQLPSLVPPDPTVHFCNEYTESPSTWPCAQISDSAPDEDPVSKPDDYNQDSSHSARWFTDTGPSPEQETVGHTGGTVVKEQPERFELEVQKRLIVISTQDLGFLQNLGSKVTAVEKQLESFEVKTEVSELGESFISEQRSLEKVDKLDVAILEQPKSCNPKHEETLLRSAFTAQKNFQLEPKREMTKQVNRKHPSPCDRCSRCKCIDCTVATPLPACWLCGRRCLCSARALLEYTTCVCCLKTLLYHCSSDDEDSSADAPFSCHKSRRCTRWSTAIAMAFVLPCLLCYGPARGCLAMNSAMSIRTRLAAGANMFYDLFLFCLDTEVLFFVFAFF